MCPHIYTYVYIHVKLVNVMDGIEVLVLTPVCLAASARGRGTWMLTAACEISVAVSERQSTRPQQVGRAGSAAPRHAGP